MTKRDVLIEEIYIVVRERKLLLDLYQRTINYFMFEKNK